MRLPHLSLLGRAAIALGLVGLAPLAIVSYQLVGENRAALTTQVLRTHAVAARTAAERTAAFLGPVQSLVEGVARSPAIAADPRSAESKALLSGLLESRESIAGIVLTGARGQELIRVQRRDLGPLVDEVLAARAAGPLSHARGRGALAVRVASAQAEGGNRVEAVVMASALFEIVRSEELGEDTLLAIADAQGQVVVASTAGVALDSFPARLVAAAGSGVVSGSGRFTGQDGREVLGAWAPVPGADWYVLSRQPATIAERVATRLRERSLMAVGAALLLTGLLSALAYRSVVRPIRDLAEAQRRLLGVPRKGEPEGSEIDQLRDSFQVLEQRVHDQDAIGQVFLGRYQVTGVLGQGGMGTVFRGWDPKLQRPVALKTIRIATGPSDTRGQMISQLLQEAITVARFNHPNIVAVYDVEDGAEAAFIAMEMVDGTNLGDYIPARFVLPPAQAVPLCAAIASALEAAHTHGIVHHDVKPGNVLLGRNGSVKVTDFGIAELMSNLKRDAAVVFGTPGYLPPEALDGKGYDQAGDVFALGAIMYYCLTGQRAIPGKNPLEIVRNTRAPIVPPSRHNPALPEDLEALIMGLLTSRRELRTRTAGQVAEQLGRMAVQNGWRWTLEWTEADETPIDRVVSHSHHISSAFLHGGHNRVP